MTTDLRFGRWQDVLQDVVCDVLCTDPPYSERVARGYRSGNNPDDTRGISYGYITKDDAEELAESWHTRTNRWALIWCDHVAWQWHESAWSRRGWMTFAPVIWVKKSAPPRMCGDGPASQADHLLVARPRVGYVADGSRPGWYLAETPRAGHHYQGVTGNKDPAAVKALLDDYCRPGDIVCDPYAGSGTTLLCAKDMTAIGAEVDPNHYRIASDRLRGLGPSITANGQRNMWVKT